MNEMVFMYGGRCAVFEMAVIEARLVARLQVRTVPVW